MSDISIKEVYEAIENLRREIMSSIQRLDDRFMSFEAGRLSATERQLAELKAGFDPVKKVVYGLVGTILIAVLGALLYLVIK